MHFEETERELRIKQLRLIVSIMIIIFLFILVYTIVWSIEFNKTFGDFKRAKATVYEQKEIEGQAHDVLKYIVKGNEFYLTTEEVSKNEIGDTIIIYYDSTNPLSIVYKLDNRRIILPIITVVFGCVCVGLVVTYVLIIRSENNSKNKKFKRAKKINES